jgi:uncharacterized protein (DUF697 family)
MTTDEQAEAIIDEYAWYHVRAAFIAGHLGGQFGLDRIPLTVLTVAMIVKLCKIFNVSDTRARTIHIATAVGRLTVRGTTIAGLFLNWIPIAGPAVNSAVTYMLTKGAGRDCVRDIKANRMTMNAQAEKAFRRGVLVLAPIGELGDALSDEAVEAINREADTLIGLLPRVPEALSPLTELIDTGALVDAEKAFVSSVLVSVSKDLIAGKEVDPSQSLKSGLMVGIAAAVYGAELNSRGFTLSERDDAYVRKSLEVKAQLPKSYHQFVAERVASYLAAASHEDRQAQLKELLKLINAGRDLLQR